MTRRPLHTLKRLRDGRTKGEMVEEIKKVVGEDRPSLVTR